MSFPNFRHFMKKSQAFYIKRPYYYYVALATDFMIFRLFLYYNFWIRHLKKIALCEINLFQYSI